MYVRYNENIRSILNPLKAFELNYANNIECNPSDYDLIIADLDSFNNYKEIEILEKAKRSKNKASSIFIKSIKDNNLIKKIGRITVLGKPITELKLIECIYKTIIEKTKNAVNTTIEVHSITKCQAESVEKTNTSFEGIADSIEEMGDLMVYLNKSGHETKVKRDEIINIIQSLSAISQENAAGTEEVSASVEEQTSSMEEIANDMQESIAKIKY